MDAIWSHQIDAAGLKLHVLEAGEGPPVLFVHGWPTNAELWRLVLERLAPKRRAIALDLPGFGKSDKPEDASYDLDFYEEVIEAALDSLWVSSTGLCLHDLGGPVGLYWAVQRVERITDLCLLNTLVFADLGWTVRAFRAILRTPGLRSLMTSRLGLALGLSGGVAKTWLMDPDASRLYKEPVNSPETRRILARTAAGFTLKRLSVIEKRLAEFGDIPLRIIYGEVDRALPDVARTMRRVKEVLPCAEITSLPGIGHFLLDDDPEQVVELLTEFFSR